MIPAWLPDTVTTDIDRALHYTMLWGLEAVELRMIGQSRVPQVVNEEKLRRRLMEYEILPASIVPGLFEAPLHARLEWQNDLMLLEESLDFCRRIGCTRILVSAFAPEPDMHTDSWFSRAADVLRRAADRAHAAGCLLAILNEADMACATGEHLAHLVEQVDHPACLAAWSPAEALRAGAPPGELPPLPGNRIALIRFRDGYLEDDTWVETLPGNGAVGWPEHLRLLVQQGFDGVLSMELHLRPVGKMGLQMATRMLQWMREIRHTRP